MEIPKSQMLNVRVKTSTDTYTGIFHIPNLRKRLSDVLNDQERGDFISLTNVHVNDNKEELAFVCLNKRLIEVVELIKK